MRGLILTLVGGNILLALGLAAPCSAQKINDQIVFTSQVNSLSSHPRINPPKTKAATASSVPGVSYGDPPFLLHATSDSPGAITYRLVSGNATVMPTGLVTLTGVGSVTVEAVQEGTSGYTAATTTANFPVSPGTPTITFNVPNITNTDPFVVAASSPSTGAFTYSVVSGPAQIQGNMVSPTGLGQVVLKASQAQDANYNAASKTVSFEVATNVTATPLDFTFAIQGGTNEVSLPGKAAFTVSPMFGMFGGPVTFSVLGLPKGESAVFTPSTLDPNAGPSVVQLYIQPNTQTARKHETPNQPSDGGVCLSVVVLLTCTSSRKLRQRLGGRGLVLILAGLGLSGTVLVSGCGSGIVPQGSETYSLSVVATSGTLTHTQTMILKTQ